MPSLQPAPRYECLYIPTQQLCAALCISLTSSVRGFYLRRRNNNSPRLPPPLRSPAGLTPVLILLVIPSLANHFVSHLIGGFPDPTLLTSSFPSSPPSSPVPHRPSLLAPRLSSFRRATLLLHTPRPSLSDLRSLDYFDL